MTSDYVETSVKILLKQVYAAHLSKVRAQDEEIEILKNKLSEADRKLKEYDTKCKRCIELEDAFNSCKSALIDQTRRFENLGQKFSVFSSSPKKTSKNEKSSSLNESIIETEVSISPESSTPVPQKSSINPQNLLKNYTSFNTAQNLDSLDLCSLPFAKQVTHDFSTLNSDTLVLAPDTVDVIENAVVKRSKTMGTKSMSTITIKVSSAKNPKNHCDGSSDKESNGSGQRPKKRMLSDPSDTEKNTKRLSLEKNVACSNPIKPASIGKPESAELKTSLGLLHDTTKRNCQLITETENDLKSILKDNSIVKNQDFKSISGDFLQKPSDTSIERENKENSPLDVIVLTGAELKDADAQSVETISTSKETLNVTVKDSEYQVSPSLLPVNKNLKSALNDQNLDMDDNDFQSPVLNKKVVKETASKQAEEVAAWTACDKKKLKKRQPFKMFRSTSTFKMHLDALPPNYKKPNYKQTKLSKSIFKPKVSSNPESEKPTNALEDITIDTSSDESNSKIQQDPIPSTSKSNVQDFDATCIPENYEIISSGNKENRLNTNLPDNVEYADARRMSDNSNSSEGKASNILTKKDENVDSNDNAVFEDFISKHTEGSNNEQMNSFDRLPKREEPKYKYKEETVRKKSERKQLDGFDCKECEKYYSELGLTDKEKQDRLKKCSRHRAKFAAPATPEHFWELEFPDTQECKARGYLNETQKGKLKTHRRRPLE